MNKIEVKCFINGENELGSSSLYLSRTEPWDQVLYKMSLKVNKPQGSNPLVYNENGVVVSDSTSNEMPLPKANSEYIFDENGTVIGENSII